MHSLFGQKYFLCYSKKYFGGNNKHFNKCESAPTLIERHLTIAFNFCWNYFERLQNLLKSGGSNLFTTLTSTTISAPSVQRNPSRSTAEECGTNMNNFPVPQTEELFRKQCIRRATSAFRQAMTRRSFVSVSHPVFHILSVFNLRKKVRGATFNTDRY